MSGKGSAPRKGRNDTAYAEGYDRIFGKKNKPKEDQKTQKTEIPVKTKKTYHF